jgi:uncharacterized membrane protein YoaK (UPF0700 family)
MSFVAGYINSAMLMAFALPVSQMTGIASLVSDTIVTSQWGALWDACRILLGFLLGAILSGWMIGHRQYRQDKSYGYALLSISGLLGLAAVFAFIHSEVSVFLAAMACGLQNAMVASFKGLQIRTTHMTGIVTDIGVQLSLWLKHKTPWSWQSSLLMVLLSSFVVGGVIGILAYNSMPKIAMVFPSVIMALLGALYLMQMWRARPH